MLQQRADLGAKEHHNDVKSISSGELAQLFSYA
jgi:hypothetical protein